MDLRALGLAVSAAVVYVSAFVQQPFVQPNSLFDPPTSDQIPVINSASPELPVHLSSLTDDGAYTALSHPHYPGHRVRVKKSHFCDPTVNVYTGYLDVEEGAKHLFFYFFESRRNPDHDDVMMWINGGPGCSSADGLFMELGPCQIDTKNVSSNGTTWNPYSWNAETNIFFLDQPVGVGFSYADHGDTVETTEAAAKNVDAFIRIWFDTFKQFEGRPLHLSGESYGGRYLPVFASEIYDNNVIFAAQNRTTLNLKSVLIGNGVTGRDTLYYGKYDIQCGRSALDVPFQPISICVRMKAAVLRCQKWMDESCVKTFDVMNCLAAFDFCEAEVGVPFHATGRNGFDVSKPCLGESCYFEMNWIQTYLDRPDVRKTLGVEISDNFTSCSETVSWNFQAHADKWAHPTEEYVAGLLERGVRVLIYAGTYDWQCNWVSNKLWVDKLAWSGSAEYRKAEWRAWSVPKLVEPGIVVDVDVGQTKKAGRLTFATIYAAGHMVPFDKPAEAQAMVSRWIAAKDL